MFNRKKKKWMRPFIIFWSRIRMACRILAIGLLLLACPLHFSGFDIHARSESFHEYQVKAVFLFNLTNFVSWPSGSFKGPDTPFIIGIIGKNPFGALLDGIVRDERIRGRRIRVEIYPDIVDIRVCHILFVSSSHAGHLPGIIKAAKKFDVLTVGDVQGFCLFGGMVNLVREDNKVKVEINAEAAKNAGLGISSKLLKLSRIVKTKGAKEND